MASSGEKEGNMEGVAVYVHDNEPFDDDEGYQIVVNFDAVAVQADSTPEDAARMLVGAFGADWCADLWRVLAGMV